MSRKTIFILLSFFMVFAPSLAFAAADVNSVLNGTSGGIVPFSNQTGVDGYFYRACDLAALANNVIMFGVGFSVVVATLMFAYAGILYVTAATSGPEQIKKAHKVFGNIFVGLILVLAAWLIVDLTLSVLTGNGLSKWGKIDCVRIEQTAAFPTVATTPSLSGGGGAGGAAGGACSAAGSGYCSPQNLTSYFGAANATNMSIICNHESGGNKLSLSGPDRLWNGGQSFSVGLFQLNLIDGTPISCPNGTTLNCQAAFNPPADINKPPAQQEHRMESWGSARSGAGYGFTIKDQNLYNQCVTAAQDPGCNLLTAQKKFNAGTGQYGHYEAWGPDIKACQLN